MGTWKLNEAKSKIPAGMMKNSTVTYAMDGDNVKVTTDGANGDGSPLHTEWTGKFDGKDYPDQGPKVAKGSVSSGRRVNERTLELTHKINGKTTATEQIELSPDLKTLTMTVHTVGKTKPDILVFERQ